MSLNGFATFKPGYVPPVIPWKKVFKLLPVEVKRADGTRQWAMCQYLFKQRVPPYHRESGKFGTSQVVFNFASSRYMLPKDHFLAKLRGDI